MYSKAAPFAFDETWSCGNMLEHIVVYVAERLVFRLYTQLRCPLDVVQWLSIG